MTEMYPIALPGEKRGIGFPVTPWTVIFDGRVGGSKHAGAALDEWCRAYLKPIILAIRWKYGLSVEDAQDVAHEFIPWLLSKALLAEVKPRETKFRSFLLGCLDNFYRNYRRKLQAQKRGGGAGEHLLIHESGSDDPVVDVIDSRLLPSDELDKAWAVAALSAAFARLRENYETTGKSAHFNVCYKLLHAECSLEEGARELGKSNGAMSVVAHRFRQNFKKELFNHLRETVTTEGEFQEEVSLILKFI